MGDFLKYKSFLSSVEYSVDDNCLFGKVMFIKSLLTYEGETLQELEKISLVLGLNSYFYLKIME